jgi:hypothetical protein
MKEMEIRWTCDRCGEKFVEVTPREQFAPGWSEVDFWIVDSEPQERTFHFCSSCTCEFLEWMPNHGNGCCSHCGAMDNSDDTGWLQINLETGVLDRLRYVCPACTEIFDLKRTKGHKKGGDDEARRKDNRI